MNISTGLLLSNYFIVLGYGVILTSSFAGALLEKKNRSNVVLFCLVLALIQIGSIVVLGGKTTELCYPLLIHLPLVLLLVFFCDRKPKEAFLAVLMGYLCCVPRHCLGLIIGSMTQNVDVSYLVQILLSFPLLYVSIRFLTPAMHLVLGKSTKIVVYHSILPFIYYVVTYVLMINHHQVITDTVRVFLFILFLLLVLSYFMMMLIYTYETRKRDEAEHKSELFYEQTKEAIKSLEKLRSAQEETVVIRHDLRHHLQYLSKCLSQNMMEEAQAYLQTLSQDIQSLTVQQYCKNEDVNLILSTFYAKAMKDEITMDIQVDLSQTIELPSVELCVILSNALENALHASQQVPKEERIVNVRGFHRNHHLSFQIQNAYVKEPLFEGDIPISVQEGHGIGVKSMITAIERCGGMYSFSAIEGRFTFQVSFSCKA